MSKQEHISSTLREHKKHYEQKLKEHHKLIKTLTNTVEERQAVVEVCEI